MAESKWSEIRCDFFDEIDNVWCVDAWLTDADNEVGKVIALIPLEGDKVEYLDPDAKTDPYAQEVI